MSGSSTPRVSICVPAYQAARHLPTTLSSVSAQVGDDIEIVVLDNASTDATPEICAAAAARDPRVRIERNPRLLPLPENWNRVVGLSRGELIKVVCSDDLIHPEAVRLQADVLQADPAIALVASRRHLIDEEGGLLAADQGLRHLVGLLPGRTVAAKVVRSGGNPIGEPGGVMFRRDDFDRAGGFDGSLIFPMDLELWMKLLKFGDFLGQRESLAAFRAGANSLSSARSVYQFREQRILTGRIIRDAEWRLSRIDPVLGTVGARWARTRREMLFKASGWRGRRALGWLNSRRDVGWLPQPVGGPPPVPSAEHL